MIPALSHETLVITSDVTVIYVFHFFSHHGDHVTVICRVILLHPLSQPVQETGKVPIALRRRPDPSDLLITNKSVGDYVWSREE